jgi:nucleoside phosphorylase
MSSTRRRAVIITALPIERTAVIEHLRDVSEEPPLGGSIYRRGIFDERSEPWDVIVAEIGAGNVGAAAEAERVISHYTPEVALFVGVAGAVKDLKHGDVVASTKVYGYESGKDDKGGFKPRPAVQLTAYGLEQRARFEAGEPDWRQRVRLAGGSAPTVVPDAKVAPIAAGEKVVASNRSRIFKFIRKQYSDAVAVEMEGLGFLLGVHMNHPAQGIVVRGISDLIEDKDAANDETWQPIAARHAAAFAFQILAKYPGSGAGGGGTLAAQLDEAWQEKHLQDARATAGPRYSAELRIGTPLHDVFEALGNTEEWLTSVRARGRKLSKLLTRFLGCVQTKDDRSWGAPFPEHLREAGQALADPVRGVGQAFEAIINGSPCGTPAAVVAAATAVLPQVRELHAALRSDFAKQHGDGAADSASFRQFQAEYQVSFPAANLDAARDLVTALEELETWGCSGPGRASGSNGILLLGGAGVGKTHGICDIAHDRFRRGLHTVVLFGEQFTSADEPWERIRQLLGFGPASRDEILEALDAAGAASGHVLLLCIDGLNESRPRGYWRSWLASLVTQVARYPNIRLCVSCRSTYEPVAVPEGHGLERVEHVGFAGMEFTACRQFFSHYGLEPPVAPSFHPEFSNPLFLRLACETLRAAGVRRMPAGWHGLSTALQAFLREKNRAFAREHERDERERVPQRALHEFMAEVERTRRVYLPWSEATVAVGRVQPTGLVGPTVLEWLVRAGLLITDVDPDDDSPDAEEVVRVAFERLGDHLFAARLLGGIKPGELGTAIESGTLHFAFANAGAVLDNQGLVEALSIQVPEHADFSTELVDAIPRGGPRDEVLRATISALPWRDPEHMTARTQRLVLEGLATRGYGHEVLDNVLAVAAQVTAPDALWLHGQLTRQRMPSRDGFLCAYLHDRVGVSSAVERLLRAPFEVESAEIPEPVCVRWATLLLWFCVAADRRVRDRATKGLVAITQARPKVWVMLIEEFACIDDEYVIERCFCAAYGALLRSRDPEAERAVAAAAYDAVFVDPTVMQNALIRDHVRCIVELANLDGVLPATIDLARVRPRYASDWPLAIPSEEDVQPYRDARNEYPKLYLSCLDDDFFTYTLSGLERYEHAVSRKEMGRWILQHVVSDLGYGGDVLAAYDGHMLYTHGGGRGRPKWAERIGKKYQLIALNRLAARLGDHVKPKAERSWEPKARGVPLVLARGRDIDPGLLATGGLPRREAAVWWLPVGYDFAAVAGQTNAEWTTAAGDVPSSEALLRPIARAEGGEWQLLEGYPTWSASAREEGDDGFTPHRQVWTHIRGYLVKRKSADRVFKWMSRQHFMGRWMPEGAEFHEGYVGEYPWGILFTMYPDRWHGRGDDKKAPARLAPVCNSVSASYEEDAYQKESINVHVPARVFFEGEGQLRWDGLSGYRDGNGHLRFLDPSAAEPGSPALLVDRSYLLDFLRRRDLAVVWAVLGEKIFISGQGSPRLEFSRTHLLDHSGILRSSDLRIPDPESTDG